ncbi:DUF1561 family protein, partial [Piscirickettsia salmonis]
TPWLAADGERYFYYRQNKKNVLNFKLQVIFFNALSLNIMNISFKKIFCFFIIVIINASVIFASPGPLPPRYFYRADTRSPDQIFGNQQEIGSGFMTWAQTRDVSPNYNVIRYTAGDTVSPGPYSARTAGWVSVAGSLEGVMRFLNYEVLQRETETNPAYWVYRIESTSRAYSVNWMLDDYINSPSTNTRDHEIAMSLLSRYQEEEEWMVRDGIRPEEIVDAAEYEVGFIEYNPTGRTITNPHFVHTELPSQQIENPALTERALTDESFITYNATETTEAHTNNSPTSYSYAVSCASVGASLPSLKEKRSLDSMNKKIKVPPPAPGCDYSFKAAQNKKFKDLPTIPSQLITTQGGYCLAPTQSRDSSMKTSRSYLYAQTCSNVESQKAIYDTLGRVVFSKSQFEIPLCMTAPENVIKGDDKWDYVEFWPCDIYNPYQKWDVRDGKLKPRLNKDLSIQWYGNYGIISKSSGTNIVLDANKMSKYFFKTPSKVNTFWYEIGMRFYDKSDNNYYPMYSGSYNSNYLNRTYYDMKNSRILMLSLYGRSFSSDGWFLSCLTSNIAGKTTDWDWVYFKQCDPFMDNVPNNLKWFLESRVNDPVSAIYIKNSDKSNLYVTTYNHFGSLFDAKSSQSPSSTTMYFDLSKRYGVCTNSSGWYVCNDPKHTRYEDDEL